MKRYCLPLLIAVTGGACAGDAGVSGPAGGRERLTARPLAATVTTAAGTYPLSVATTKDARLFVPQVSGNAAVPLLVMLHGAGGDEAPVDVVAEAAAGRNVAVLIPRSRASTWDLAAGGFGDDVGVINRALEETFRRVRVDPARIVLAGFSDGASYALTLGIANGDLFSHIVAFAPGFLSPVNRFGNPDIFIAHGSQDVITSPHNTEQNIVPFLRALGYTVRFHGFTGGHAVNAPEADVALAWFMTP